jgi:CRISPR/Cas system-associated exonuclease Cas4 (RecB family)
MGRAIVEASELDFARSVKPLSVSGALLAQQCKLAALLDMSPGMRSLRVQSLQAALGEVFHRVILRAAWNDDANLRRNEVESIWDEQIVHARERLDEQARLRSVPSPERWPGYERVRLHALKTVTERQNTVELRKSPPPSGSTEVELRTEKLTGRADRVIGTGGNAVIVEFKSRRSPPSELIARDSLQLQAYMYLWHTVKGSWPKRGELRYPGQEAIVVDPQHHELSALGGKMESTADALSDFASSVCINGLSAIATASAVNCRFCSYRLVCKAFFMETSPNDEWVVHTVIGEVQEIKWSDDGASLGLEVSKGTVSEGEYSVIVERPVGEAVASGDLLAITGLRRNRDTRTLYSDHNSVACHGAGDWLGM